MPLRTCFLHLLGGHEPEVHQNIYQIIVFLATVTFQQKHTIHGNATTLAGNPPMSNADTKRRDRIIIRLKTTSIIGG